MTIGRNFPSRRRMIPQPFAARATMTGVGCRAEIPDELAPEAALDERGEHATRRVSRDSVRNRAALCPSAAQI
jgi:hypothetical protein